MPNKYGFALTRAEKLRILAKKILDKFHENGVESTQDAYNILTEMNA